MTYADWCPTCPRRWELRLLSIPPRNAHYIPEKEDGSDTLTATKALNRNLSEKDKKEIRELIWKVDVSGLKGGLGTIITEATKQDSAHGWRVDRQNPPSGYVNIQVSAPFFCTQLSS